MSEIGAKIKLDFSGFLAGMKRVDNALVGAQSRAVALQAGFGGIIAVFAQVAAFGTRLKASLDLGGKLSDLAAMSGASAGEMLVLQQAMVNAGMGGEAVGGAVAKLQKALAGVNEDGQSTADVFTKLGLNSLALAKMSLPEQLASLAGAFQRIEDPSRRAQLAMALFGRSGAELLPLLRAAGAFATAEAQVGGLADTMNSAAGKFDTLSDSIGALGLKTDQFFAAFANAVTDGAGVAKTLDEIDFTSFGQTAGQAAAALAGALQAVFAAVTALVPVFAGMVAQMVAVRLNAAASGGAISRIFAMEIPAAIGQARVQMALFGMSMRAQGVNLMTFRAAATAAFTGIVGAAKAAGRGVMAAFGPVGWVIMAATEAASYFYGKMQQAVDTAKEMNRLTRGFAKDIGRNSKSIMSVSGEDDRANVAADIDQQLENVRESIANVDEDFASLGEKGIEEARWRLEIQQRLLEKQRETLANLSPEIIAANAAEKERQRLLAESAKEAENLSKELERALEASDKAAEKRALAAMSPDQAESAILGKAGATSRAGLAGEISALRGLGGDATADQKRRLLDLLAISEQLLDVDSRREDEQRRIAESTARAAEAFADLETESRSMAALAGGDAAGAAEIDRQGRATRMARGFVEQGMGEPDARALADAQTRLSALSGTAAPQSVLLATASRGLGLGGNAYSNAENLQKLQAERQREGNRLLTEIRELLKRRETIAPAGEMVFS